MSPIYVPGKVTLAKDYIPVDPEFANVSLLLHGDGTNGSTTIVDSSPSPKTVTAYGNAQISTAQSKFGGSSIAFDGSGDYLEATYSDSFVADADFTAECWIYPLQQKEQWIIDKRNSTSINRDYMFLLTSLSKLAIIAYNANNGSVILLTGGTTIPLNTWTHVAFTRSGNLWATFINGVLESSGTQSGIYASSTSNLVIGREIFNSARNFNGYIDDLRITKGVARYTANFTPPTAPFPDIESR